LAACLHVNSNADLTCTANYVHLPVLGCSRVDQNIQNARFHAAAAESIQDSAVASLGRRRWSQFAIEASAWRALARHWFLLLAVAIYRRIFHARFNMLHSSSRRLIHAVELYYYENATSLELRRLFVNLAGSLPSGTRDNRQGRILRICSYITLSKKRYKL